MLYKSNLTIETAVANQSKAMEAETISKHGRSLKRRNIVQIVICVVLFFTASFLSNNITVASTAIVVTTNATITADEAGKIALNHVGSGTVVLVKTKSKKGVTYYEVYVVSGSFKHEVKVSSTGAVTSSESKPIEKLKADTSGTIGVAKAKSIAIERAGGGIVTEVELERSKSSGLVFEVEVINGKTEYEIKMNANTGAIINVKTKH